MRQFIPAILLFLLLIHQPNAFAKEHRYLLTSGAGYAIAGNNDVSCSFLEVGLKYNISQYLGFTLTLREVTGENHSFFMGTSTQASYITTHYSLASVDIGVNISTPELLSTRVILMPAFVLGKIRETYPPFAAALIDPNSDSLIFYPFYETTSGFSPGVALGAMIQLRISKVITAGVFTRFQKFTKDYSTVFSTGVEFEFVL